MGEGASKSKGKAKKSFGRRVRGAFKNGISRAKRFVGLG